MTATGFRPDTSAAPERPLEVRAGILRRAIGPYPEHCAASPGTPGAGYAACPSVHAVIRARGDFSRRVEGILGFDAAEVEGYFSGINASKVSSFCGPDDGLLPGLDLLPPEWLDGYYSGTLERSDGVPVPIYALTPVQEASAALLGAYRPRPASFMRCALVYETLPGPAVVGAALAIGIPEDRARHACLFMEEAIADPLSWRPRWWPWPGPWRGHGEITPFHLRHVINMMARSVLAQGDQAGVPYARIYAGAVARRVPRGCYGTGLVGIPYVQLPRDVDQDQLLTMPPGGWQQLHPAAT